jgi:hypothetical protein
VGIGSFSSSNTRPSPLITETAADPLFFYFFLNRRLLYWSGFDGSSSSSSSSLYSHFHRIFDLLPERRLIFKNGSKAWGETHDIRIQPPAAFQPHYCQAEQVSFQDEQRREDWVTSRCFAVTQSIPIIVVAAAAAVDAAAAAAAAEVLGNMRSLNVVQQPKPRTQKHVMHFRCACSKGWEHFCGHHGEDLGVVVVAGGRLRVGSSGVARVKVALSPPFTGVVVGPAKRRGSVLVGPVKQGRNGGSRDQRRIPRRSVAPWVPPGCEVCIITACWLSIREDEEQE